MNCIEIEILGHNLLVNIINEAPFSDQLPNQHILCKINTYPKLTASVLEIQI